MKKESIFQIQIGNAEQLATKNLIKGTKTKKEKIVIRNNEEFLEWNPYSSKLGASIRNGLQILPITENSKVVCINTLEDSTVLHISNIVGDNGSVFILDLNKNNKKFQKILDLHKNINLIDNTTDESQFLQLQSGKIDVLYLDNVESELIEATVEKYSLLLKNEGFMMLIIKKDSNVVIENDIVRWMAEQRSGLDKVRKITSKLESKFDIVQEINLGLSYAMEPFHKFHILILAQYIEKN